MGMFTSSGRNKMYQNVSRRTTARDLPFFSVDGNHVFFSDGLCKNAVVPAMTYRAIYNCIVMDDESLQDIMGDTLLSPEAMKQARASAAERVTASEARVRHAFKRLKERGLYVRTLSQLLDKMDELRPGVPVACSYCSVLDTALGVLTAWDGYQDVYEIADELWMNAIELTVMLLHPDAYKDSSHKWAVYLNDDIKWIYTFVYLLIGLSEALINDESITKMIDESAVNQALCEGLTSALASAMEDKDKLTSTYEGKIQKLETRCQSVEEQLRQTETSHLAAMNQKDKEIQQLRQMVDSLLQDDDEEDEDSESEIVEQIVEDETFLYSLPEDRVLFMGGHPNLVKKLRQIHPGWRFRTKSVSTLYGTSAGVDFIFIWHKHLSHACMQSMLATSLSDVPMVYVDSVNLNKLELEMLRQYNDYKINGKHC